MATLGKIKCDFCGFVGDLETKSGQALMKIPAMWVTVKPMICISGNRELKLPKKREIKGKIESRFPHFHLCPGCVDNGDFSMGSLLAIADGKQREQTEGG